MELVAARGADRHIFARMPDNYLAELAAHRERDVGATDSRNYPYLDAYFSERGRYPFVIRRQGAVAGFSFIRGPASTGRVWEVAEFYVVPCSRCPGIGKAALASIWWQFPDECAE
jgi:predicted acetyltransferase